MVNKKRIADKQDRQKNVLDMVIKYHIGTAEPVGSHSISDCMGLSSATIRNIMYDLEEMGLIRQPHTSAGRVPTSKGYRQYVDSLLEEKAFLESGPETLDEAISLSGSRSIEDIIVKCLQLCSKATSQTCIALFPTLKLREYLREGIAGDTRSTLSSLYDFEDRLYFDGAHYLATYPEFRDAETICNVLKALEDRRALLDILEEDSKDIGVKVHIGNENKVSGFNRCTLITANYSLDDNINGSLGIIGPMRMEYEKVIPVVNSIAETISEFLDEVI